MKRLVCYNEVSNVFSCNCDALMPVLTIFVTICPPSIQAKDRVRKLERLRAEMPSEPPPGWQPKGSKHADNEKDSSGSSNGVGAVGAGATGDIIHGGGATTAGFKSAPGRPSGYGIKPSLKLPKPPPVGVYPLKLKDATIGWPTNIKQTNKSKKQEGNAVSDGGERSDEAAESEEEEEEAVPLLTKVSFAIEKDMRLVVRGPNGSGKSTLVKALAGKVCLYMNMGAKL